MQTVISLDEIKTRLKAEGFGGLLYPGECCCSLEDLAPCGSCEHDDGMEDYINGCDAGYKHIDPRDPNNWCISMNKEPPTLERWLEIDTMC